MNIRAKIFGRANGAEESPIVQAKAPRGVKADTLNSIPVVREESRRGNTRDEDRHRLTDERVQLSHNGDRHEARLINLSGGGAMIDAHFRPMLWDRIDLHLGENGTIECAVRWLKDDRIGLEFAHETRLDCSADQQAAVLREVITRNFPDLEFEASEQPVAAPVESEHRAAHRHPLIWSGTLHHDFQSSSVRLRNISETGALVECSVPPRVGAEPLLDLGEEVQVSCVVAWVVGDSVGLRFTRPFDLTQLARTRPGVAPARWDRPSYLQPNPATDSPWDEQWQRMSLPELRQELEGFMKR
jgi:hypothetical protein